MSITGASGNGKTTFGRALAERLGVPFVEVDALYHGPNWTAAPDDVLRERVDAAIAGDAWVVDGTYRSILGDRILARADTVVWLDLPLRVVLWRLLRRTHRRISTREELWSGNVESGWRDALLYLIWPAAKAVFRNRRTSRERFGQPHLRHLVVVRLRSSREVTRWLSRAAST